MFCQSSSLELVRSQAIILRRSYVRYNEQGARYFKAASKLAVHYEVQIQWV